MEFREDIQLLGEKVLVCREYRKLVEILKGDFKMEDLEEGRPGRQYAGILEDMSVEETLSGPIILVSGLTIFVPFS